MSEMGKLHIIDHDTFHQPIAFQLFWILALITSQPCLLGLDLELFSQASGGHQVGAGWLLPTVCLHLFRQRQNMHYSVTCTQVELQ